ncbi:MAG: imidazole glycerol phosphate synthase subunit HisH, partial [Gemmatimonadetes bacterium]|nr:imidazole glycerol phosphate synthase subunit HisH [Gemmatimonadota bacterium]NIR79412.1 imidazole glycerol phosphate synthase subunit HisH [Gemmatimonadota bacterium]NIT89456.1 imidazole glycerol phosphate synthase subunit HisH [Gemmatimonadota bacterium]NIU33195.1 imidazole glycerol phosphate synthase subunit HisH [Gemmatimonadota bacterium]NIV63540.1 imidazole glycerol phosphate synthase subunit HisH [Gemmatimonadota bacterium]
GNLHSLEKALERGGAAVAVTADWDDALDRDALVLPGVGAFGAAVRALGDAGPRIRSALEDGLPCLGICLGMQLLFDRSEEGEGRGIGVLSGGVRRLSRGRVPQMGWNDVETADDPLFRGAGPLIAYYANSYVCEPEDPNVAIAWSSYEGERFVAGVRRGTVWGVQFHPEKSSSAGLRIVENFLGEVER